MGPPFHHNNIIGRGIATLAVLDRVPKAIVELPQSPKQVGLHEADHGVVCRKACRNTLTQHVTHRHRNRDTLSWDANTYILYKRLIEGSLSEPTIVCLFA